MRTLEALLVYPELYANEDAKRQALANAVAIGTLEPVKALFRSGLASGLAANGRPDVIDRLLAAGAKPAVSSEVVSAQILF